MKLRFILSSILLLCFFMLHADAKPLMKKKFENPALQFEGTWRVDSYDFREFEEAPNNLDEQFKKRAGAFPIGQSIRFVSTGSEVMPGTIDPITMKSNGPIGETLEMTVLQPFGKKLCEGYWKFLCNGDKQDYANGLMITNMVKWENRLKERREIWEDIKPIEYTLVHLGKSYNFDIWVAKNGDMVIPIVIEGRIKGGGEAAVMGIRLKKIKK